MTKTEQQNPAFAKASGLHRDGRLADAIPLYEQVLREVPNHRGASNLLGVALLQAGRPEEAAGVIRRALDLDPRQPGSHYNFGTILQALKRHEEAIVHYEQAIALAPGDAETHNNLGAALKALGRYEEAAASYRKALGLKPDYVAARVNLAAALFSLERYEESLRQSEKALALNPELAEAHVSTGNALRALDRCEAALRAFDRAIAIEPRRPEPYRSAGNTLIEWGHFDRAIPYFEKAASLNPESAGSHFKRAICLWAVGSCAEAAAAAELGFARTLDGAEDEIAAGTYLQEANRHDEAIAHFEKALALDPNSASAHHGIVRTLEALRRYDDALGHLDRSIEIKPGQDSSVYNRSLVNLALERFPEGWAPFETRFSDKLRFSKYRPHSAPRWDGKKIAGTLAVWGEQGLGDQILYASMIPDALARAGSVILEVEPRLIPLFARSFPGVELRSLAEDADGVRADAHVPIGGLGEFFRQSSGDFPRRAYLKADPERASALRGLLPANKMPVGISWRSINPKFGMHKTAMLRDFSPLFMRSDVQLVDLQYGNTSAERAAIRKEPGIEILHLDEIDNTSDIDGLAALIEACDAVLTVDNTTAHIAGALGKPVWVMVPHGQGRFWYWFKDRADSPWYPGMRICRQQSGQPWADLIASAAPQIADFVQASKA